MVGSLRRAVGRWDRDEFRGVGGITQISTLGADGIVIDTGIYTRTKKRKSVCLCSAKRKRAPGFLYLQGFSPVGGLPQVVVKQSRILASPSGVQMAQSPNSCMQRYYLGEKGKVSDAWNCGQAFWVAGWRAAGGGLSDGVQEASGKQHNMRDPTHKTWWWGG